MITRILTGVLVISAFGLVLSAIVSKPSSFARTSSPACPDESPNKDNDEKPEDCPWAGLSRELENVAAHSGSVTEALSKSQPVFFAELQGDAKRKDWLDLWGLCINFDELAQGIVVPSSISHALVGLFNPSSGPSFNTVIAGNTREITHAGIQHTYGYLFSNLKTSFGYKRARWVLPTLDKGFGLPVGTLAPLPIAGSLFSNATYFAGKIAFRDEPMLLKILDLGAHANGSPAVSGAVYGFDFSSLKPMRLEETIHTDSGDVVIRTDLVPFLHPVEGDANTHWLIYSITDHRKGKGKSSEHPRLITAFPVTSSFVDTVFAADGLGDNKPIITRYNAFVDGITGTQQTGSRRKL